MATIFRSEVKIRNVIGLISPAAALPRRDRKRSKILLIFRPGKRLREMFRFAQHDSACYFGARVISRSKTFSSAGSPGGTGVVVSSGVASNNDMAQLHAIVDRNVQLLILRIASDRGSSRVYRSGVRAVSVRVGVPDEFRSGAGKRHHRLREFHQNLGHPQRRGHDSFSHHERDQRHEAYRQQIGARPFARRPGLAQRVLPGRRGFEPSVTMKDSSLGRSARTPAKSS